MTNPSPLSRRSTGSPAGCAATLLQSGWPLRSSHSRPGALPHRTRHRHPPLTRSTKTSAPQTPTASVTPSTSPTTAAEAVTVTITDFAFSSPEISVSVGQTVTVVNSCQYEHTFASDAAGVDTGTLAPGDTVTVTVTFTAAGAFDFHCEIHPDMTGLITVS